MIKKPSFRKLNKKIYKMKYHLGLNKAKIVNTDRTTDYQKLVNLISTLRPIPTQQSLIRIGGFADGGYLIPNDLEGIEGCFSPGVSSIADFEEELAENYQIKSFLADYSVEKAPIDHPLFEFDKKFLGNKNDETYIRLEDWMKQKINLNENGDYILQMDIEGAEYDVLQDTPSEILKKFRIIALECHDMGQLFKRENFEILSKIFEKLTKDFSVVHIHPNNNSPIFQADDIEIPHVLEFTFLRKDRVISSDVPLAFPHPLDKKNLYHKNDIILPKLWQNDRN